MKIEPSLDRVIVKQEEKEEVSAGGIVLAPTAQEENRQGVVVAVGPGAYYFNDGEPRRLPVAYKPGDRVQLPSQGELPKIKLDGETYVVLKEGELLGRLTNY